MSFAAPGSVPSERLCRVAAIFGLPVEMPPPLEGAARGAGHAVRRRAAAAADELHRRLRPGRVALVTGPSGAGKSLVLAALRDLLGSSAITADPPGARRATRALVDLDPLALPQWLGTLARAGLAEASLLTRTYADLSEGQRRRADLALAMARATRRARAARGAGPRVFTLVADEFAAPLDRVTARGVARTLRRWVLSSSSAPACGQRASVPAAMLRAVVATSHDDLVEALRPHVLVHVPLDAPPEFHEP